jgi:hypothetical protein
MPPIWWMTLHWVDATYAIRAGQQDNRWILRKNQGRKYKAKNKVIRKDNRKQLCL